MKCWFFEESKLRRQRVSSVISEVFMFMSVEVALMSLQVLQNNLFRWQLVLYNQLSVDKGVASLNRCCCRCFC